MDHAQHKSCTGNGVRKCSEYLEGCTRCHSSNPPPRGAIHVYTSSTSPARQPFCHREPHPAPHTGPDTLPVLRLGRRNHLLYCYTDYTIAGAPGGPIGHRDSNENHIRHPGEGRLKSSNDVSMFPHIKWLGCTAVPEGCLYMGVCGCPLQGCPWFLWVLACA